MALVLYPTDGYNAFISLADCNTFLTENVPTSQRALWDALTDPDKELYIKQATLLIKNKITLPDTLEDDLQHATAYLANYSVDKDMLNSSNDSNLKRKRVEGVIDKEWFSPTKSDNNFPDIVDLLLSSYGAVSDGSFTFVRA